MTAAMILCIDDQAEVLAAVTKDLAAFSKHFAICGCDSAPEARELLAESEVSGQPVALIIADCVMPEEDGVSFLASILTDGHFPDTRRILLTGQANHEQTIDAINAAHIHAYLAKPWQPAELQQVVRTALTHWLFDSGRDWQHYRDIVDQQVLMERLR